MYFDNIPKGSHPPVRTEAHLHATYRRLYTILKTIQSPADLAKPIARTFMGLFAADGAVLCHIFDDGARFVAAEGALSHMLNLPLDFNDPIVSNFLKNGKPVCRSRSELADQLLSLTSYSNFESLIIVPIIFDTHPAGCIALSANIKDYFSDDDAQTLMQFTTFLAMLIANRERDIDENMKNHFAQLGDTCSKIAPELHKSTIELIQTFAQFRRHYVSQKYNLMAEYLGNAVAQIENMAKSIQALRTLGEICTTKIENIEHITISTLIEKVVDYNRTQIDEIATVSVDIRDNLPAVLGDFSHLWQAVHELIQNALRALQKSTLPPQQKRLDIRAYPLPNRVVIEVRDNGCGIQPCDLPKIFDPYFSTHPSARGMGLTRARLNMLKMNGQLFGRPNPDAGMVFKIVLPDEEHTPQIEVF